MGLVGLISSLPGRPEEWKSSASWSLTDGLALADLSFEALESNIFSRLRALLCGASQIRLHFGDRNRQAGLPFNTEKQFRLERCNARQQSHRLRRRRGV